jgi:hypothetical protein
MINNAKRIINHKIFIKPMKIILILIKKMKTIRSTTIYQKIAIISKDISKAICKSWKNNILAKKKTFKTSTIKKTIIACQSYLTI